MSVRYGRTAAGFVILDGMRLLDRAPWLGGQETDTTASGPLLCPVVPSKIVCVGRNYVAHARELGNDVPNEPLLFLKPPSALVGPGEAVVLPAQSTRVEHEAELGVVVGARLRRASEADATRAIFGLVPVCDVTARDLQKSDGQWTRAKGFDTFCPVGPEMIATAEWLGRDLTCRVNGSLRQQGNTRDMVFGVPRLLSYISACMTLEPGDLIVTGTPEGVGPLAPGDTLRVEISGVAALENLVAG